MKIIMGLIAKRLLVCHAANPGVVPAKAGTHTP